MGLRLTVHVGEANEGGGPVEILRALDRAGWREIAMLHSAGAESASVMGIEPLVTVEVDGEGEVTLSGSMAVEDLQAGDALGLLEELIAGISFAGPHPLTGWLGFVSYDMGRMLDEIPDSAPDILQWPILRWSLYRYYVLHDAGAWRVVGLDADPGMVKDTLKREVALLKTSEPRPSGNVFSRNRPAGVTPLPNGRGSERNIATEQCGLCAVISSGDFLAKVERVKEYIAAGDIYQANLAQHWEVEIGEDAVEIYARLCVMSPAPYAGFLRFVAADGIERAVLSASPELFLQVNEGRVVTRPIKGTRRRDLNDAGRDNALREELLASEKDRAELAMIVDLLRNDLGRVAEFGTVQVEAARELEKHPTVWHTAATISATLRKDAGLAELLGAVCPGGSITGAPKIRAMQIIEELEGFRRGMYCGTIGVIGAEGKTMQLNIAIRSIVLQQRKAHVYAGGGIVADSEGRAELQETVDKAGAMLRALGVVRVE